MPAWPGHFERQFSVEAARAFKPSPLLYRMVAEEVGVAPSDCCMVASHVWDTIGAQSVGFSAGLITRAGNAAVAGVGVAAAGRRGTRPAGAGGPIDRALAIVNSETNRRDDLRNRRRAVTRRRKAIRSRRSKCSSCEIRLCGASGRRCRFA